VGEEESAKRFLIVPLQQGALLAVIDGLGCGRRAAQAVEIAVEILQSHPGEPIAALLDRCHVALCSTRGVTMMLAEIRGPQASLSWGGIGNVEATVVRASPSLGQRETALRLPGVLGFIHPRFDPTTTTLFPGDVVVLATSGAALPSAHDLKVSGGPQALALRILGRPRRHPEALVLAARFRV
jgi:hypothetical protein